MGIRLFEHNRQAYDSASAMLSEHGRAAVIHPTGTGKSFIGFRLCEDNPDSRVLWLSPSERIFRTQLENLADVAEGWQPENIIFLTYAKLKNLLDDEIRALCPDYIILDEFHRCGALGWGEGIRRLMDAHSSVPTLGLTATAIRYLDDQRDMAEELFEGCVASEMTLGEAIVRGIIHPPKYVLCMYSYQTRLERYENRIRNLKRRTAREDAEACLEKLRRRLGDAEGIGKIFAKHMPSGNGKYIVFCSDYEHLLKMRENCREWLRAIDPEPRMYTYYTLDTETRGQFEEFKNNREEDHIKLLFCIDALNEGVHVEDVSGVILLRPTASPIVYKQQIGRALTASGNGVPLIFDIVNNVEGLYSVGALREEIQLAREYFDATGRGDWEVNGTFELIDETADCRLLFEQLEEALSVPWEEMYEIAKEYYRENHTVDVPVSYRTEEDYPLGRWLETQRRVYRGSASGILDAERKRKLEALGMRWDTQVSANFDRMYAAAQKYQKIHGNLNVPAAYTDDGGARLGEWIRSLRKSYRQGRKTLLSKEQIRMLEELGMDWNLDREKIWEENRMLLKKFREECPNGAIPEGMKTASGRSLKTWEATQISAYRKGKLSAEKTRLLQEAGVRLDPSDRWMTAFQCANDFYRREGHLNFPKDFVYEGVWMNNWVEDQAGAYHGKSQKRLTDRQRNLLEEIGIKNHSSLRERRWQENYRALAVYFTEHGDLAVPADLKSFNGTSLRSFLNSQRAKQKTGELSQEKKELLEKIGMVWEVDPFENGLRHAKEYAAEKGNLLVSRGYVCEDGFPLGEWIRSVRGRYSAGRLSPERVRKLEQIGMAWRAGEERFFGVLEDCRNYYAAHGDLRVPEDYVGSSGVKLSYWLSDRRRDYRKGRLSEEKVELLKEAKAL